MKKSILLLVLVAIVAMSSCEKESITPDISKNVEVGDEAGGGIVGHIYDDGTILIVSKEDIHEGIKWGVSIETHAIDINDGRSNTDKIIAMDSPEQFAAELCDDYRGGGHSDWYMPAANELVRVRVVFPEHGIWWSSTELINTRATAYSKTGNLNAYSHLYDKDYEHAVRAVRKINP